MKYHLNGFRLFIYFILFYLSFAQYIKANPDEIRLDNISYRIAYGKVIIEYDLIGPSDRQFKIMLLLKREMNDSFVYEPVNLSGDIGIVKNIGSKKQIIWDIAREFPEWFNPKDKDYYFVLNVYLTGKGISPYIWIGGGAALLGGGAALLFLKKDNSESPSVIRLPNPPGRP
jgi:hypothetical protein